MTEHSFPHALPADGTPDDGSIATEPRYRQVHRWDHGDGILRGIGEELEVKPMPGQLAVRIGTGEAKVDGEHYVNDDPIVKTLTPAHATKIRYDRIVLRLTVDATGRGRVRYVYVEGVAGDTKPRPLVRTATVVERSLAAFPVPAGAGVLPPFPLRSDRFATSDRLAALEPLADFRYLEREVPGGQAVELTIPASGGTFIGFDVNRASDGVPGNNLTVLRDGVYELGITGRYGRDAGAPKVEVAFYVEARRGAGGGRIGRVGTIGPDHADLSASGALLLRAGDVLSWMVERDDTSGSYDWTLSDSTTSLRGTARFVREFSGTGIA